MYKAKPDTGRTSITEDTAVTIINDVKAYGRGEVVIKISDGEIRKINEIKKH